MQCNFRSFPGVKHESHYHGNKAYAALGIFQFIPNFHTTSVVEESEMNMQNSKALICMQKILILFSMNNIKGISENGHLDHLALSFLHRSVRWHTFPCSFHSLHHISGVKCEMNMEMYIQCWGSRSEMNPDSIFFNKNL